MPTPNCCRQTGQWRVPRARFGRITRGRRGYPPQWVLPGGFLKRGVQRSPSRKIRGGRKTFARHVCAGRLRGTFARPRLRLVADDASGSTRAPPPTTRAASTARKRHPDAPAVRRGHGLGRRTRCPQSPSAPRAAGQPTPRPPPPTWDRLGLPGSDSVSNSWQNGCGSRYPPQRPLYLQVFPRYVVRFPS